MLREKSDDGDFGIEANIGKLDHSFDLAGHRGTYENESRIYPSLAHLLYVGDARIAEGTNAASKQGARNLGRSANAFRDGGDANSLGTV